MWKSSKSIVLSFPNLTKVSIERWMAVLEKHQIHKCSLVHFEVRGRKGHGKCTCCGIKTVAANSSNVQFLNKVLFYSD
ncbi:hypothetical protein L2E82_36502 [Cichorium intybus]|uniref:Uncharacterized protein n=1 Tax=Cichorium intybus TaxID=13427 RepID=A0ACB9BRS8_CICIN|nr:hypothetical protein L2E82_36502 [Cichorium intybus]